MAYKIQSEKKQAKLLRDAIRTEAASDFKDAVALTDLERYENAKKSYQTVTNQLAILETNDPLRKELVKKYTELRDLITELKPRAKRINLIENRTTRQEFFVKALIEKYHPSEYELKTLNLRADYLFEQYMEKHDEKAQT
jgi:hypothetical protein